MQHRHYDLVFQARLFDALKQAQNVPSVTPSNLVELMKREAETENQPSLPKSSYRGLAIE